MNQFLLAVGLFLLSFSVYAAGVARLVVSHAQFTQISAALSRMCDGGARGYVNNPSSTGGSEILPLSNYNASVINASHQVAIWCAGSFRGSWVNVASFYIGGDFDAIGLSLATPGQEYIDVDVRTGNVTGMSRALADGGFVDFDLGAFDSSLLADYGLVTYPSTEYVSYASVYGLAVSGKLYVDLQKSQGLTGCGINDVSPSCQPSISRAMYASIISEAFTTVKQDVNAAMGVGAPGDKLTLCRFGRNFGSERAADEYFLRAASGSDGVFAGAIGSANAGTYAAVNSGLLSFDLVEVNNMQSFDTCLTGRGGYAVGVMPMQRFPVIYSGVAEVGNVWRYVKLNNVEVFDPFASRPKAVLDGRYDFWFYASKYSANSKGQSIINAIDAQMAQGPVGFGVLQSGQIFDRAHNFAPVLRN